MTRDEQYKQYLATVEAEGEAKPMPFIEWLGMSAVEGDLEPAQQENLPAFTLTWDERWHVRQALFNFAYHQRKMIETCKSLLESANDNDENREHKEMIQDLLTRYTSELDETIRIRDKTLCSY